MANKFRKSVPHGPQGHCQDKCNNLKHEHKTLTRLDHPNIVKCDISFYQNTHRCCLKLEQAGCDYLQYLTESYSANGAASFPVVISLLRDLLQAVSFIHEQNLTHNDIKPENCLLFLHTHKHTAKPSLKLKLADFEFAAKTSQFVDSSSSAALISLWKYRNTKQMSPELLKLIHPNLQTSIDSLPGDLSEAGTQQSEQLVGTSVCLKSNDIYNLGLVIFSSFFGMYPFEEEAHESDNLYSLICNGRWESYWQLFQPRIDYLISTGFPSEKIPQLLSLLQSTITNIPDDRLSIQHLISHPFFL